MYMRKKYVTCVLNVKNCLWFNGKQTQKYKIINQSVCGSVFSLTIFLLLFPIIFFFFFFKVKTTLNISSFSYYYYYLINAINNNQANQKKKLLFCDNECLNKKGKQSRVKRKIQKKLYLLCSCRDNVNCALIINQFHIDLSKCNSKSAALNRFYYRQRFCK